MTKLILVVESLINVDEIISDLLSGGRELADIHRQINALQTLLSVFSR